MKKFTTLLTIAILAIQGQAKVYNGQLTVNVNGSVAEQAQPITIEESNGTYTLSIKNFCLTSGSDKIGVGNIVVSGLKSTGTATVKEVATNQKVTIEAGDDSSIDTWMGPILGEVPIDLKASFSDNALNTSISIDMSSSLNQLIKVNFISDGLQLRNTGFENFHTSGNGTEPNGWHSFTSATGKLASVAGVKVKQSDEVRPGTDGQHSAVLYSSSIIGIIANGTMTTGRLNAEAYSPADAANHSFLDMSSTDLDGNNDPFYTTLNSKPDSVNVWVKFKQQKANASYPYATISAAITDGTYYQDPTGGTAYNNVAATASNSTIESKNAAWQNVSIPFAYTGSVDPKAILITISTNATPGKGGGVDSLYVDDIKHVYNTELDSIKFRNAKIEGWNKSVSAYSLTAQGVVLPEDFTVKGLGQIVDVDVQETIINSVNKEYIATITSYAGDLSAKKVYTFNITSTTGINEITNNTREIKDIYNLQGIKVNSMERGIYVVRYTDGTTAKVIK